MATAMQAIQYLRKHAAMARRSADDCNAFGRIGSDDAAALEKPLREHAAELDGMAQALTDYNNVLGALAAKWRVSGPDEDGRHGRANLQVITARNCADELAAAVQHALGVTP